MDAYISHPLRSVGASLSNYHPLEVYYEEDNCFDINVFSGNGLC